MSIAAGSPSFLGRGWGFPPSFGPGGAELVMAEGMDDVHQSLAILFATRPGERPWLADYGGSLSVFLFEELDHDLVARIHDRVADAVLRYEPRIELQDVSVARDERDPGLLHVTLDYVVRGTNSRYNMVFPFYLNEAVSPGV